MTRLVIIVLTIVALLTGCAQAAQKVVEQATGVQVDSKGDKAVIQGKDGETLVVSSQTPDELKDFPVPRGFQLESAGSVSSKGDKLVTGTYKGKGAFQAVAEFYKKALGDQRWQEELSMFDASSGGMLTYSKGEQSVSVVLAEGKSQGEMEITVLLSRSGQTPTAGGAATAKPTTAPARPEASPAPELAATRADPALVDASAVPAELKDIPAPRGFGVVKGSTSRLTQAGKFQMAHVEWYGKGSLKDVADFYKSAIGGKGWNEGSFVSTEDSVFADYVNAKDENLILVLAVETSDPGLTVSLTVTARP